MVRLAIGACAVVIAVTGVSATALAQQAQSGGPVSLGDLFVTGTGVHGGPEPTAEFKPGAAERFKDAARQARAAGDNLEPGQCPKPKVTVTVASENDEWGRAVANARVLQLQDVLGADAGRFTFATQVVVTPVAGTEGNVKIDASIADAGPPAITVDPPSGTKVRQGQRLRITVTAAEPETGWQAGIKQIQIEDLDRRTNLEPWTNPAAAPRPCANVGFSETITRRYRVPDVPVARLKITARDYHNPPQAIVVEYPTGDWYGQLELSIVSPTVGVSSRLDVTLDYDGRGNIEGRMAGDANMVKWGGYECPFSATPAKLSARLVGQYTPGRNTMSLTIAERNVGPGRVECVPPEARVPRDQFVWEHGHGYVDQPVIDRLFRNLAVADDGSVEASGEDSAVAQETVVRAKLSLRKTMN